MYHAWNSLRFRTGNPGYVAQEFLTAGLSLRGATPAQPVVSKDAEFSALYAARLAELERRLEAESAVSNVTFSLVDPGNELAMPPRWRESQFLSSGSTTTSWKAASRVPPVCFNRIAPDLFSALDVPHPSRPRAPRW